ncbi:MULTISPECIES: methyl-accepting chemotaxis protein [Paenibacillus]|uniref:Methyl-accepting chemotaxis protein n=1 Tax=Paenibacillus amylolyticus TaxID=1451 RepID=A0ABD8AWF2_PAEAM|nr:MULTISPECIES: methyl-accepting chemotaxis protein [Paenibacillus]ETT32975.1 methyl-accepting chemotaxis protein [Paenibacillus sp. FSL R5-192]KLU53116.1 chemotaxis protein [Paenibacillus sp. VT-400]OMF44342.1 methyl-accepting chemotaxis protein [Paenibacillus amylolyticus]PKQ90112.1 methyl-accepting chemotaxis protein [Paenibacillus sp. BGI2013]WFA83019.1 methyl-accepting chemotaxis protein [Paenibacillus amylolyticus]
MKWTLGAKTVAGLVLISIITYGTSGFFIFFVKDWVTLDIPNWVYISIILIMGVCWNGILGWFASRWLTRPIVHLSRAAQQVSAGDLTTEIPQRRTQDELTVLYDAFRAMVSNLRSIVNDIADSTRTTSQNAQSLSEAITQAAEQIEMMSDAVDHIAVGVEEQKVTSHQSLITADEMLNDFQRMHSQSMDMTEMSGQMERSVDHTKQTFSSLMKGMDELAESHNRSRDIMLLLEKEASDIEVITQSVKNIAEETGLLALNASIEAARAGEEGSGFAVVAQQIRKLADESKESVHRINELISRVQERIRETAQLSHEQHGLVVNESERTVSVDQTLHELTGTVEVFMKGAHDIGSKIAEQTGRVEQTHGHVKKIQGKAGSFSDEARRIMDAAHEETAIMEEISSSAEELRQLTDRLLDKTKAFRMQP